MSAVVLFLGAVGGLVIGIQGNFFLAPAHAHPNLIGGEHSGSGRITR